MRCVNCSGRLVKIKGDFELRDKILGDFTVPNTEYEQCEMCGEKLYTPVTLRDIEKAEERRKNDLMLKKPIEYFILAAEVAELLGCTRQALHKHKRIRRGFIHFLKHHDMYYYLKESVELYKETGDGRIPLVNPKPILKAKIVDFSKYREIKQNRQKTECMMDACSDRPCIADSKLKQPNYLEKLLEG